MELLLQCTSQAKYVRSRQIKECSIDVVLLLIVVVVVVVVAAVVLEGFFLYPLPRSENFRGVFPDLFISSKSQKHF